MVCTHGDRRPIYDLQIAFATPTVVPTGPATQRVTCVTAPMATPVGSVKQHLVSWFVNGIHDE